MMLNMMPIRLDTVQLFQQLEAQLARGEPGVLAAQATADQADDPLACIEHGLNAPSRCELT